MIGDAYRMSGLMRCRVQGDWSENTTFGKWTLGTEPTNTCLEPCDIDMAVVFGRELWGDCEWLIMLQNMGCGWIMGCVMVLGALWYERRTETFGKDPVSGAVVVCSSGSRMNMFIYK